MIDTLIFSKDRAMELNSLLESIQDHFNVFKKITILYRYSNDNFKKGYDKIIKKFGNMNIDWILESNFKADSIKIINSFIEKYCILFVDDEWFIRTPNIEQIYETMQDNEVVGFSLRLGDNFTYAWNAGVKHVLPEFIRNANVIKWQWKKCHKNSDYGYPFNLNSMIRRTVEFQELVNRVDFTYPNNFEMAIVNGLKTEKEYIAAFNEPITFLNCLNVSQTHFVSRNIEEEQFNLEKLNQKWLDGYILNFRKIYNKTQECPTMALAMEFIKE